MIDSVGLLNRKTLDLENNRELAYTLGIAAWKKYREKAQETQVGKKSIVEAFASAIATLPAFASMPLRPQDLVPAEIECVSVWDTVGSLGIPTFGDAKGHPMDAFRFADNDLSPKVKFGFHAVSLDDQR